MPDRSDMKRGWVLTVPFVMILGMSFLPAINGPHLWFGLPSLMITSTFSRNVVRSSTFAVNQVAVNVIAAAAVGAALAPAAEQRRARQTWQMCLL